MGLSSFGNQAPQIREVVNVKPIRDEYQRIARLSAQEARAEYERTRSWTEPSSGESKWVADAIKAMDSRGAWVTNCRVLKLDAVVKNGMNSGDFEMIKGYSTGVFIRNLGLMTAYVKGANQ